MVYLDACLVIYWVEDHSLFGPQVRRRVLEAAPAVFAVSPLVMRVVRRPHPLFCGKSQPMTDVKLQKNAQTDREVRQFVMSIRQSFASAAEEADQIMLGRGFGPEDEAHFLWLESLADVTNALIRQRNEYELGRHLQFFSWQFDNGTESVKNCIDVSYVENLAWNLGAEDKEWVWPLIPENLRQLHMAFWGR